jgi:hypothetical protein
MSRLLSQLPVRLKIQSKSDEPTLITATRQTESQYRKAFFTEWHGLSAKCIWIGYTVRNLSPQPQQQSFQYHW